MVSFDTELALVRACQSPESDEFEAAFEALYTRYRDRVYSIAYRITGKSSDAMDVMQEAFCLLYRKISGFRFDSQFSTWLFRLVVNCSIDHVRRERSRGAQQTGPLSDLEGADPVVDSAPGPSSHAEQRELDAHVHARIQRLSPKLRAILVLRYLEGLSYEELSETLEVSMGTVKSRLARAHVALERSLSGTLAPFGIAEDDVEARGVG